MSKPIRVGVVGVRRGETFLNMAPQVGMELVAICDTWEDRLNKTGERLGVATYTDFDAFLEHEMDAVVLANYFHEHAPYAVQALDAGMHVMSETAAVHTLAEGVELARAVERTGGIYMFAENYPYFAYNQEMRSRFQTGEIGEFRYGEGEYIHPGTRHFGADISPGTNHWRNWIPATYYCTHALAPVMFITDTRPEKVNGLVIPHDFDDPHLSSVRRMDTASIIMLRMDNDAVVKLAQVHLRGHGNYTRIHGNCGLMENARYGDRQQIVVRKDEFDTADGKAVEEVYVPDFPVHAELAEKAGHGGGDFFTSYYFAEAIRTGEQPYLDVYRGIDMSIVGVLAWRSALADGATVEVPDFRDETVRKLHEDDHWSPDPTRAGHIQSSLLGKIKPTQEDLEYSRGVWRESGMEVE
jgi:predicted dehydrogenase